MTDLMTLNEYLETIYPIGVYNKKGYELIEFK